MMNHLPIDMPFIIDPRKNESLQRKVFEETGGKVLIRFLSSPVRIVLSSEEILADEVVFKLGMIVGRFITD